MAVKARGKELGSPHNLTDEARAAGAAMNHERAIAAYRGVVGYAKLLKEQGLSLAHVAARLNDEGHRTRRGKRFHANTVWRVLR